MAEGEWSSAAETRYTSALWRMYRSIVGECSALLACFVATVLLQFFVQLIMSLGLVSCTVADVRQHRW
jgi:hypothetical protein